MASHTLGLGRVSAAHYLKFEGGEESSSTRQLSQGNDGHVPAARIAIREGQTTSGRPPSLWRRLLANDKSGVRDVASADAKVGACLSAMGENGSRDSLGPQDDVEGLARAVVEEKG
jgi:hypothetical protein